MYQKLYYTHPKLPEALILLATANHLVYCNWDNADCERKLKRICRVLNQDKANFSKEEEEASSLLLKETSRQLDAYFNGELTHFNLPLKYLGTEFQKKVWAGIRRIGYGKIKSYKDLAALCGNPRAVRAIAGACGANPLAVVIPCHRVCMTSGKLGGYTGGRDKKVLLLEMEAWNCKIG